MIPSLIFIFGILIFVNWGLVFLIRKYKDTDVAVVRAALIALIFIDGMSCAAFLHVLSSW